MNQKQKKLPLIFIAFKKALNDAPSIFKLLSVNFGFYFLGLGFLALFLFSFFFSNVATSSFLSLNGVVVFCLLTLSHVFNVFIIPYYAYKKIHSPSVPVFWDFISRTVYPLVIAHIKATLLILLFFLLLIVPGIYKKIRFTFLNETVFFDGERSGSSLKKADQSTISFFWPLILFLVLSGFLSVLFAYPINKIAPLFLPSFLSSSLKLVISFYISCFLILWKTLLYFEIKKFKGESISL